MPDNSSALPPAQSSEPNWSETLETLRARFQSLTETAAAAIIERDILAADLTLAKQEQEIAETEAADRLAMLQQTGDLLAALGLLTPTPAAKRRWVDTGDGLDQDRLAALSNFNTRISALVANESR